MAKDSFVYLIKQFSKLSLLTDDILDTIKEKLKSDNRFPDNNASLIIRNSRMTDKMHADQVVRNNPVISVKGVSFSLGAMAGQQPGLPGQAAENQSYVYALQQFDQLSVLTPALLNQFRNCFSPGDPYAALLIRKEQHVGKAKEKAKTDEEVAQESTVIIDGTDTFDQGSVKGTPPGSTASLDEIMALKAVNSNYVIRQFGQLSDLTDCNLEKNNDFPLFLHYSTKNR